VDECSHGPNAASIVDGIFQSALNNKIAHWYASLDATHEFIFVSDAAKAMIQDFLGYRGSGDTQRLRQACRRVGEVKTTILTLDLWLEGESVRISKGDEYNYCNQ
jgi:hypothetical protein